MGAIAQRRLRERIELLCDCGAGLEAIASPLTHAIRDYIGAASGSLFWLDDADQPSGFYHDSAPAEIKDIFISRLDDLFLAPGQDNMVTLTRTDGPAIGRALDPAYLEHFWGGNIYRHLCVPLNHRWMLDMRIDVGGEGRALFAGWQVPDQPFTASQAAALEPIRPMLARAIETRRPDVAWRSLNHNAAQFATDLSGTRLLAINDPAERVLMASHLLRQQVPMTGQLRTAPGFAIILAQLLAAGLDPVTHVPVADGRIVARGSRSRTIDGDGDMLFVTLDHQVAADVVMVEHVMALALTPLQRRIALYAMRGGARAGCGDVFAVSAEALKKHLRAVFDATGAGGWSDLVARAGRLATG